MKHTRGDWMMLLAAIQAACWMAGVWGLTQWLRYPHPLPFTKP